MDRKALGFFLNTGWRFSSLARPVENSLITRPSRAHVDRLLRGRTSCTYTGSGSRFKRKLPQRLGTRVSHTYLDHAECLTLGAETVESGSRSWCSWRASAEKSEDPARCIL